MFMIAPVAGVRQAEVYNAKRRVHAPTAMLDQLTPFWPGSFWTPMTSSGTTG
jgi:hypothetical protein